MYTVDAFSKIVGVSKRTLHYYDEIGLLSPQMHSESGYRLYGAKELDAMQQILLYKRMGFSLKVIGQIMYDASYDPIGALKTHLSHLQSERIHLDRLILTVERTIIEKEGGTMLSDKEKFEGFKKTLIEENDRLYGDEIKSKYSAEEMECSRNAFKNMSKETYDKMVSLEDSLKNELKQAVETQDFSEETQLRIAKCHKRWLEITWGFYKKEAHLGVVEMYVTDERFTAYYDAICLGAAAYLKNAVENFIYTS